MLNDLDKRLLALLSRNARQSTSELSRILNVSRSTVQGRIKRLEQTGIITGYTTKFGKDFEKQLVTAQVQIKLFQKLTAATVKALRQMPQVKELYAVSGDYDMIAIVRAESMEELSQLLDAIGLLQGIERTNSSVILETKFSG